MPISVRKEEPKSSDIAYGIGEESKPLGFQEAHSMFDHDRLASEFGVTKRDIAETAGLSVSATYRKSRASSPLAEARLTEMGEILRRVTAVGRRWAAGARLVPRRADPRLWRPHRRKHRQKRQGFSAARLSRSSGAWRICLILSFRFTGHLLPGD